MVKTSKEIELENLKLAIENLKKENPIELYYPKFETDKRKNKGRNVK